MADPVRARGVLTRLAASGVRISVDDFGTGHSSLAYLKNLPISELKIDRSFVRNLQSDDDNGAIVTAAIDLGRSLGLRVVAEGAETQAELHELARRRCELVQGFAISRPLSAEKLEVWLRASDLAGVFAIAAPSGGTLAV
jgi:EAL domain-containing protein (putative c-di-GMP-specific phosphodiesterase class I)